MVGSSTSSAREGRETKGEEMTAAILSRRGPPQGSLRDEAKLVESHVPSLRMTAIRALTARCLRHAHCAERYAARGKVVRWRETRDTESSLDVGSYRDA